MSAEDVQVLRAAVERLERQSFAVELANKAGMPVEALIGHLPLKAQDMIGRAVRKTLEQCLHVALTGMRRGGTGVAPRRKAHTMLTAATGAAGGFFGLPGMVVELPVTTTVMLHSIAEIARSEGEDLGRPEGALACLEVLALGSSGARGESVESGYYATRTALAQATREAATYLTEKGLTKTGTPVVLQFLSKIGARFGIEVSEKAAAQLMPIAGAVGGLTLNVMFTRHFQKLAEGHFTVRRLERKYGVDDVGWAYEQIRARLPK